MFSRIKKLVLTTAFISLNALSCKSTIPSLPVTTVVAPTPVVEIPKPIPPSTVKISRENWEITLPSSGWTEEEASDSLKLILFNKDKHNLVIMVHQKIVGTPTDYVMSAIKGLRNSGAKSGSINQVEVDERECVLLQVSKENIGLWLLITVANDQGYGLSCGGSVDDDTQRHLCSGIIQSLKIK